MCKKTSNKPNKTLKNLDSVNPENFSLDTLAQVRKSDQNLLTKSTLVKKARAKYMTQNLVFSLANLKSCLQKSYWNSYHCNTLLQQKGKVLSSKYCNNRWCAVCNRVRVAKLIKGYYPILSGFNEKFFITLTVPNCNAEDLQDVIEKMNKDIRRIFDGYFRKTLKLKALGIKKIEVTYNPQRKYQPYHPHFHFILNSEFAGIKLIEKWLELNPLASSSAQDIREANDNSVMELFKYFAKTAVKNKKTGKIDINPTALDVIYTAMYGKRVYQAYGITKISEDIEELHSKEIQDLTEDDTVWKWLENDWIDESTGECLTGYTPNEEFIKLVKSIKI